jgi:predicted CxxxxCH...CXXCH cytochrome family protein
MAATHRPLLCIALAALAAAGCDGTARTIAGQPAAEGAGCTTCHGDSSRVAESSLVQAAPATGAHLAHLQGQTFRDPIACSECHPIPASSAHVNQRVDFAFGPLASARGVTPSYVDSSGTCTTACHGEAASPAWTSDPTLDCASCHGLPPAVAPHDPSMSLQACATCHPGTVLPTGALNRASKLHLDGKVDVSVFHSDTWSSPTEHGRAAMTELGACASCHGQDFAGGTSGVSCNACHQTAGHASWTTDCTFCHGDRASGRASPPLDTQGRSDATNVSVGVHAAHVGTTIASPLHCDACHPSRGDIRTDTAHIDGDGIAEVQFGALAKSGGAAATYTRTSGTSATCASTYCHGRFTGGVSSGSGATMSWTSTTPVGCTSCHGSPPSSGRHSTHSGISCYNCHNAVVDASNGIVGASLHVNGVEDVRFGGTRSGGSPVSGTWNPSTRSCSVSCHGSETW